MGMCKVSGGNEIVVGNNIDQIEGMTPNSRTILIDEQGNLIRMRWYGSDGRALIDRDFNDHNRPDLHPNVPHDHPFDWNQKSPRQQELDELVKTFSSDEQACWMPGDIIEKIRNILRRSGFANLINERRNRNDIR